MKLSGMKKSSGAWTESVAGPVSPERQCLLVVSFGEDEPQLLSSPILAMLIDVVTGRKKRPAGLIVCPYVENSRMQFGNGQAQIRGGPSSVVETQWIEISNQCQATLSANYCILLV